MTFSKKEELQPQLQIDLSGEKEKEERIKELKRITFMILSTVTYHQENVPLNGN